MYFLTPFSLTVLCRLFGLHGPKKFVNFFDPLSPTFSFSLCIGEISEVNWKGFAVSSHFSPPHTQCVKTAVFCSFRRTVHKSVKCVFSIFGFQSASESISLLSLGRNSTFLIRKLSITFPCAGHRAPRYLTLYIG